MNLHSERPKLPAADGFRGSVWSAGACSRFRDRRTIRKRRQAGALQTLRALRTGFGPSPFMVPMRARKSEEALHEP